MPEPTTNTTSGSAMQESTLERIERRLARIERALDRFDQAERAAPGALATAVDTFDEIASRFSAEGVDVDERLRVVVRVAERLTAPEALATVEAAFDRLHGLRTLLQSGVLDPAPVAMIAKAGKALAEAGSHDAPKVGAIGALRALGDPNVQRALGFLVQVAHLFGSELGTNESKALLTAKGGDAE